MEIVPDLSDGDSQAAPGPVHQDWLLEVGQAVVEAVLDVDVRRVPRL